MAEGGDGEAGKRERARGDGHKQSVVIAGYLNFIEGTSELARTRRQRFVFLYINYTNFRSFGRCFLCETPVGDRVRGAQKMS